MNNITTKPKHIVSDAYSNMTQQFAKEIDGRKILITGGTGSFGNYMVKTLLNFSPSEIIIFSRDEFKQFQMRVKFPDAPIKFMIGDVRDFYRVLEATRGMDIIFHAAALKQVPYCEDYPYEAVLTNIVGAQNVERASVINRVEKVLAISTDKAVKPVNVMGMTKAIQERLFVSSPRGKDDYPKFACVRYGNVTGSRGSVIPFFKEKILRGEPLPLTDRCMTRFLLSLKEGIALVLYALVNLKGGEVFVKKSPACKIIDLAEVMARCLTGKENYPIVEVGIRPGEKIHEVLVSEDEMRRVMETEEHYIIFPYGTTNDPGVLTPIDEYTSQNTRQLTSKEIEEHLRANDMI